MSLPEIKLVIQRAEMREARQQIQATRNAYLASAAKWSKPAAEDLNKQFNRLAEIATGAQIKPKTASTRQLASCFAALGIPQQTS